MLNIVFINKIFDIIASIGKKLAAEGLQNTEEIRRQYRQTLLTAPAEVGKYLGGVILFDETFRQKADDGTPFVEEIKKRGFIPGIKVRRFVGPQPLASILLCMNNF